jgi:serine/threonine protein kinase
MVDLSGKKLGNYQIIERIGRGGMAEVYKGYHPKLDRVVAIKILHGFLAEGEDFLARFEREAKAVASLRHQNIVQIHDFDLQDDHYYMVMEFIDGETLNDKLRKLSKTGSKMPLDEVESIIKQVAAALEYAHKRGIIHRDIKPSNILIDKHGQVYLTDFGIARIASTTQFTTTGALIGTPAYMSPEQCKGVDISHVSDLYSLGIILYEMLAGKVPYDSETPLSVLQKHITEPVPSLYEYRTDLPSSFERIISKSLAKEPEDRYQSAIDMSNALSRAIADQNTQEEPVKEEIKSEDSTRKPTVLMQVEEIPASTVQPTVVMEENEKKVKAEAIKETPPKIDEKPEPVKPVKEKPEVKEVSPKGKLPLKIIIPAAIGVVALILVFSLGNFGSSGSGGGGGNEDCFSIENCHDRANGAWDSGDPELSIYFLDRAIEMVPPDEHPPYANLWCQRAGYMRAMNRMDEATANEDICRAWERGE